MNHQRDKFKHICYCPSEFLSLDSTTHQCALERGHEGDHECAACLKTWRTIRGKVRND